MADWRKFWRQQLDIEARKFLTILAGEFWLAFEQRQGPIDSDTLTQLSYNRVTGAFNFFALKLLPTVRVQARLMMLVQVFVPRKTITDFYKVPCWLGAYVGLSRARPIPTPSVSISRPRQ